MWIRKILVAALVAAPLALSPVSASAQERGAERAAAVSNATGGPTVTQLPAGIAKKVDKGGVVPFGIDRRYSPPAPPVAPQPQPQPEPEPQPEEPCSTTIVFINGQFFVQDCNGNLFPL